MVSDAEIDAIEKEFVRPEMYNAIYEPMFARNGFNRNKSITIL